MATVIPPKGKAANIRATWDALDAPQEINRFTHECIQSGIWSQDEMIGFAFNHAKNEVRTALRALDSQGLPFAGPSPTKATTGSGQVWKQRTLWDIADYEFNVEERVSQVMGEYRVVEGLKAECLDRYHHNIPIPTLS